MRAAEPRGLLEPRLAIGVDWPIVAKTANIFRQRLDGRVAPARIVLERTAADCRQRPRDLCDAQRLAQVAAGNSIGQQQEEDGAKPIDIGARVNRRRRRPSPAQGP